MALILDILVKANFYHCHPCTDIQVVVKTIPRTNKPYCTSRDLSGTVTMCPRLATFENLVILCPLAHTMTHMMFKILLVQWPSEIVQCVRTLCDLSEPTFQETALLSSPAKHQNRTVPTKLVLSRITQQNTKTHKSICGYQYKMDGLHVSQ